jgi:Coatomer beta subunit appendage platform
MLAAYSVIMEARPCLSGVLIRFLSPTGEDALANLSIEKTEAGNITGHVRIRSKTQGIALSLGDRITMGEIYVRLIVLLLTNTGQVAQKDNKPSV